MTLNETLKFLKLVSLIIKWDFIYSLNKYWLNAYTYEVQFQMLRVEYSEKI